MSRQTLLGIERSLQQSRWMIEDVSLEAISAIRRHIDMPEIVLRLLLGRGITPDQFQAFLTPTLKDNLPSPFLMADMEAMAGDVAGRISAGQKMAIFGDFDVDGATSSAVLHRFLKACGIDAPIYIPDRLVEGYGPNIRALEKLKAQGAELVFILDCGSTAFEVIEQGRALGLDIIVMDHHQTEERFPPVNHIINPKRHDDTSGLDMLAACGVTFMACVAINNKLKSAGFFEKSGRTAPNLITLLDLVALGTVCDMVPLVHVNRLLVRSGFMQMQVSQNTGLKALIETSKISNKINTYHAGFILGPRINAGGRIQQSDLGAKLLTTEDHEEAVNIAWILNDCNDKRKEIQAKMEREAFARAEDGGLADAPFIMLADESWHPGLSGLVAGKIKDRYGKPACIVTFAKNADGTLEGRGSGRSIPGVNIGRAFMDAMEQGIVSKGGGHAMAGGFTVSPENLERLQSFLQENITAQLASGESQSESLIDGVLSVQGAKIELLELLEETIGPFGQDFPEPVFAFSNVKIFNPTIRGETHISVMISDWEGGARMKAMAFGAVGTPLGEALLNHNNGSFHVTGKLKINEWQGRRSAELHIEDAASIV